MLALCGFRSVVHVTLVEAYDAATNSWSFLPPMPGHGISSRVVAFNS
jgi:hypothetical protein